ncbi:MAG: hypothetical protein J6W14_02640 [Clostridia bacterium]|nr:hypothetical protein [Clostridia bacterium]
MKNRELYAAALRLIAESTAEGDNPDYEERAPYLLAVCAQEAAEIDRKMRKIRGLSEAPEHNPVFLDLDSEFPLLNELMPAAILYLAAMLILEDDESRSDVLYDRYCDTLLRMEENLPASLEAIADRYGNL